MAFGDIGNIGSRYHYVTICQFKVINSKRGNMLMEKSKLSDYEKFIVMADNYGKRGSVQGTMQTFIGFKEVLKACQECSKSDADDFTWRGEVTEKPINRSEAQRMLDDFENIRWNPLFKKVANKLKIELR